MNLTYKKHKTKTVFITHKICRYQIRKKLSNIVKIKNVQILLS